MASKGETHQDLVQSAIYQFLFQDGKSYVDVGSHHSKASLLSPLKTWKDGIHQSEFHLTSALQIQKLMISSPRLSEVGLG